ncbi:MAG: hypothetical protein RLZZ127_2386 [Planctomycetota bacterium]|jgi:hypothetical protein
MDSVSITPTITVAAQPGASFAVLLIAVEIAAVATLLSVAAARIMGRVRRGRMVLVPLAAALPHLPGWALIALFWGMQSKTGWSWSGDPLAVALAILGGSVAAAVLVWRFRRSTGPAHPWGVAALVLAVIASVSWHQARQAAQVENQAWSARAGAALVALRPGMPPAGQNAAIDIQRAIDLRAALEATGATEAAESTAADAPILPMIEAAADKPVLAMPRNLVEPLIAMRVDEISMLRQGVRALQARARSRAAAGDADGAWDDAARMHRLADLAEQEPLLITQLVAASLREMAFATVVELTARDGAVRMPPVAAAWDWRRRLEHTLIVEEAYGLQAVEQFVDIGLRPTREPLMPIYRLVMLRTDLTAYREGLRRRRDAVRSGLAAVIGSDDDARRGLIDGLLRPATTMCAEMMARADAQRAVIAAAGSALAHHRRAGSWPTVPATDWPRDPCDGQPLRLKPVGDRLRIWSVGANLRDDGGIDGGAERRTGDVVVELRPPR